MKGVTKCLKFLALFAMPLLCLCQSSDVSALKHQVKSLPVAIPYTYHGSGFMSEGFYVQFASPNSPNVTLPENLFFASEWNGNDSCRYSWGNDAREWWSSQDRFAFGFGYYRDDLTYSTSQENYARCMHLRPFGDDLHMDWGTVPPYVFGAKNWRGLSPYWFSYAGMFLRDDRRVEGFDYDTKLDFAYLFNEQKIPNKFYEMNIPIGAPSADFGDITVGRHIEVSGEFLFDSDSGSDNFSFPSSSFDFTLMVEGYSSTTTWEGDIANSQQVTCNYEFKRNSVTTEYPWILTYSCPFDSEYFYDSDMVYFTLNLRASSGQTYIWDYPATHWLYEASFITTDYDDSPGGAIGEDLLVGKNIDQAPGAATQNLSQSDVNWFSSLSNLFDFSFINPFSGIFGLFSDQNSCASIPTIAGMIHSQETTICPWFDSNTRNIVTPVLGLASAMLIFGFAVRWLGGSSGNLFSDTVEGEDIAGTTGVYTSRFHFSNKYRSRK